MSGVAPPTSAADVIAGLQMDGGVGVSTARVCVDSGTNLLFAGPRSSANPMPAEPVSRGADRGFRRLSRRSRFDRADP